MKSSPNSTRKQNSLEYPAYISYSQDITGNKKNYMKYKIENEMTTKGNPREKRIQERTHRTYLIKKSCADALMGSVHTASTLSLPGEII